MNITGSAKPFSDQHGFNSIHISPKLSSSLLFHIIKITMDYYTVFSTNADTNQQPHLLVHFNKFETVSALAREVEVLSRSASSFPSCPFGVRVQLAANGQILNGNHIIQNVIPDPRAIIIFADYSNPRFLHQGDASGQTLGLYHSPPQHIVFDQTATLGSNPTERTIDTVENRGRNEQYEAIQGEFSSLVPERTTSRSPAHMQQPFPRMAERRPRRGMVRARQVDPAFKTAVMEDVSEDSPDAPAVLPNRNRPEDSPRKVPEV